MVIKVFREKPETVIIPDRAHRLMNNRFAGSQIFPTCSRYYLMENSLVDLSDNVNVECQISNACRWLGLKKGKHIRYSKDYWSYQIDQIVEYCCIHRPKKYSIYFTFGYFILLCDMYFDFIRNMDPSRHRALIKRLVYI